MMHADLGLSGHERKPLYRFISQECRQIEQYPWRRPCMTFLHETPLDKPLT